MLKAIRVSAMLLVLVGFARAGEVLTPPATQPPPPATAVQEPTTDGIMQTPLTTDGEMDNGAATTFMQVLLNLLALS